MDPPSAFRGVATFLFDNNTGDVLHLGMSPIVVVVNTL